MATLEINDEIERLVKAKLDSGRYASPDEVLLSALRSLEAIERNVAAIEEGIEDVRAGRTEPFEQADAAFRKKYNIPQDA